MKPLSSIRKAVTDVNGYVESSVLYTPSYERSANLTLRVPAASYSAFVQALGEAGSITRTEEGTEDVTNQHIDVSARLRSLKAQEERLLALLEESGSLEELIALQDRLSEVQYQIDSYTSQLQALDDRIDYATVHVSLYEVVRYTPIEPSFGERIGEAFQDMVEGLGDGAENFVLGAIRSLPGILVLVVIIIVTVVLVKRRRKRKLAAQAAPQQPTPPASPAQ